MRAIPTRLEEQSIAELVDLVLADAQIGLFMYQMSCGALNHYLIAGTPLQANIDLLRQADRGLIELIRERPMPASVVTPVLQLVSQAEIPDQITTPIDELKRRWRPWVFALTRPSGSRLSWNGDLSTALGIVRYTLDRMERCLTPISQ